MGRHLDTELYLDDYGHGEPPCGCGKPECRRCHHRGGHWQDNVFIEDPDDTVLPDGVPDDDPNPDFIPERSHCDKAPDHMEGNRSYITDMDVRVFLGDHPATNKLLGDFEFSQEEIRAAMTYVVDKWNDTPPMINNFRIDTFPFRWAYLVGTTAGLLNIAAHKYRRNNLVYNVPGGSINDQDKAPSYDAAAAQLWKEFNEWMTRVKVEINLTQAWGSDTQYYGFDKWW
jgi:hypothetical protein